MPRLWLHRGEAGVHLSGGDHGWPELGKWFRRTLMRNFGFHLRMTCKRSV
jgi:hypothetical protein